MFKLASSFRPTGDQPQAIDKLTEGIEKGLKNQVLLGVTGSGKTFTMANVIQKLQMPALIISHNKTLAGQLYQEMREFFPDNAVSYFVSYYDYYQPEAYIPQTDTYIEKEAEINDLIDKLRLQSTTNIMTKKDVIVVASVSCIYNIGSPTEYDRSIVLFKVGNLYDRKDIFLKLAQLQYERSEFEFKRGTFRVRGDSIDIYPAYEDYGWKLQFEQDRLLKIAKFEPLSGQTIDSTKTDELVIYPAKHFMLDRDEFKSVETKIRVDLKKEYEEMKKQNKPLEAERLLKRTNYDLEMIKELGYVNGIENYSRYFDGRKPGEPPFTLLDYYKKAYGNKFLVFIDESHMTMPQIRGMYNGDYARKKLLVEFGFRVKAAFDNRPLKFNEFYSSLNSLIYVSATPNDWEIEASNKRVVEQLVRPTGIVDPMITIRPASTEIQDLIKEIEKRVGTGKILVMTLTKKTAEDLSVYLKERNIRAEYLHSDIHTLERSSILDNLRKNEYDVLIGVNLLREGLDIPEVTLVAILDADREGFLRSKTSLVQTMGRAARNIEGRILIYADKITSSLREAISEIERRRNYQLLYNKKHNIKPKTIYKPLRERISQEEEQRPDTEFFVELKNESLTPYDRKKWVKKLESEMRNQAESLNFELAIKIRDKVRELKSY